MSKLSPAILATIIYYDILDFPLTAGEIFKFLINPSRLGRKATATSVAWTAPAPEDLIIRRSPEELMSCLDILVKNGKIEEKTGFYFLQGRASLGEERIEKNKIAELKWKKTRRYLWLTQAVPYLEAIFANGSLALGHMNEESDLDVLIIARNGHIWLVRLLLSLLLSFLGIRRKNKERIAPNKICLNHYISTASLEIPFYSLYNAQTYAHLTPVYWRDWKIIERFWKKNSPWIEKFICRWEQPDAYQKRAVSRSQFLSRLQFILEKILERTGLTGLLEKLSRKIQLGRINTNLPGRITVDDRQLEFHPYSAEKDVLRKYNRAVAARPIFGRYEETDSGLQ